MFLPVLCCLAFVAQQSAAQDVTRVKDKSKEWKEGSVWEGIGTIKTPDGKVGSGPVTLVITKRDGKSFSGRIGADEKHGCFFEGEVDANGDMKFTITRLIRGAEDVEENIKHGYARNLVGVTGSGKVDANSVNLKAVQPDPDHPKDARIIRTWKFKLKADD
jgi:hypothetical protein